MKSRKIIIDMLLNIIAGLVPIAVLQLIILPKVSIELGDEKYGLVITLISVLNLIPATFGNVLNNIRLLNETNYNKENVRGDFNILLIIYEVISSIAVFGFAYFYIGDFLLSELLFMILTSFVWMFREYYIVTFRIKLNYIAIFLDSLILGFGFLCGWGIFKLTNIWEYIYLMGYLFSSLFILILGKIWKEPYNMTFLFKPVLKDSILLSISNLFARMTSYADKLLLFPLLGGATVSIYYAATIFSKIASIAVTPVSSVILSYISKDKKIASKSFPLSLTVSVIVCLIVYICCCILGKPVLNIVYPQYVEEAYIYIPLTSAAMIFSTLASLINPYILKFFKMKWQIILNFVNIVIYILLSYVLLNNYGLVGFCWGTIITNMMKVLFMLVLYWIYTKKKKSN